MSRKPIEDRLSDLARAIDTADEVMRLARHPAVAEWMTRRESLLIETMLAASDDELPRCRARIEAHREFAALLTGIETGRATNLRRYDELRKQETHHA